MPIGDIALYPQVSGDAALIVVDTQIVAFDAHGRAVHAALIRLRMEMTGVEHRTPSRLSGLDIVREELRRRFSNELVKRHSILLCVCLVYDRHALMREDVIENRVFVSRVVPDDGLIEHHDEKPIDRLREEELAKVVGRERHGGIPSLSISGQATATRDNVGRKRASQPASYTRLPERRTGDSARCLC